MVMRRCPAPRTCCVLSSLVCQPASSSGRTHSASVLMLVGSWCMAVAVASADWKRPSTSGSTAPGHTYDRWHSALQLADTRAARWWWGGGGGRGRQTKAGQRQQLIEFVVEPQRE